MREYRFRQFERNRYFPGKTLTVRDFKAEQEYYNQKRYMINRLVHGTGILWGLQVQVDNTGENVSINPGMAIDCFGREIIIGMPVNMRISDIEGAPTGGITGDKEVDLCVEYSDDDQEPVEMSDNFNSCCKDGFEYNRIKEKYKFKIGQKVNSEAYSPAHLLTNQSLIYKDEVSVTMTTPVWVNPNELFPVRITIERTTQKAYSIAIKTILNKNLNFNDDKSKDITVDISNKSTDKVFTKEFYVRAASMPDFLTPKLDASIRVRLLVKCPDSNKESEVEGTNYVQIVETSISDVIVSSYFKKENQIIDTADESVKLACLKLVKNSQMPLGFKISEVLNPGFGEYMYSNDMLYELLRNLDMRLINQKYPLEIKSTSGSVKRPDPGSVPSVDIVYKQMEKHLGFDFGFPKEMATGIVYFDIDSEILIAGDNGITEVIDPGLGKGPVYVNVQWEQCRYRETVAPKDSVVFGAYPNTTDGTFRIWYRVIEDFQIKKNNKVMPIHTLHFRWWAYTNVHDRGEARARRFSITPKRLMIRKKKDEAYTLDLKKVTANFAGTAVKGEELVWGILPQKPAKVAPNFKINNDNKKIAIPAGAEPQSFILKGIYQKEDVFDKVFVTIVNET